MRYAVIGLVALGCGELGGTMPVADPALREGAAEEDGGLDACADLLVRCVDLGVSDDTALRAFDECVRANVRGDEDAPDREGDDGERDGDDGERDGDDGDERDPDGGDPERPA
jgi:hypothetical protein